jgi:uncharacterized metal-binding protein YceD (DUF177 family)
MKITIDELKQAKDNILNIEFDDEPEGIDLAEPAHAKLIIKIIGEGFINIKGKITGKINVTCDNCLQNFIYKAEEEIDETYAEETLYPLYKEETEIKDNFFAIDLNGAKEIDLTDLMYQSLILSIPNKLVCGINCIGSEETEKYIKSEIQDPRLEVFKTIKTEKDN